MAPDHVTNAVISARTGVRPHQTVFQITRRLAGEGVIEARQYGKEWEFWWAGSALKKSLPPKPAKPLRSTSESAGQADLSPGDFEKVARRVMEARFSRLLPERLVEHVAKKFDFVADDFSVIGDAKYFSLVKGTDYPPAKMSIMAEHIWLLENTGADELFLVFGNDRRVPEYWLDKYGHMVRWVKFFYLSGDGVLVELN